MNTLDYLVAIRAKFDVKSDYAIAKLLGVSKQAAGRYSKGQGGFDDDVARRVAALLDIHPGIVVLDMHRERAQTPETRALWQEIFKGFLKLLPHAKGAGHCAPAL